MSFLPNTHILTVNANIIHKVDTGNPANLYNMWTAGGFGKDLLTTRKRLLPPTQTLLQNIPSETKISNLPQLSGSIESLVDEEAVDFTSVSAPLETARPRVRRQDSCASTRRKREHHIRSDDFEKIIVSIVKDKGSLSAPPHVAPVSNVLLPVPPAFERSSSTTTEPQSPTRSVTASKGLPQPSPQSLPHSTVRSFLPSQTPTPQTISGAAQSSGAILEPKSSPFTKVVQSKMLARFTLGGSCSSSEQDHSLINSKPIIPIIRKSVFQIGSSEEDGSLKSVMVSSRPSLQLSTHKKQASFRNNTMTRPIDGEVAVGSDTDDYVDESAIDDDNDSSDWEDIAEESSKSSMDDKFFQRVDSNTNLASQQSLITLMLVQNDRARNLGNNASQSTSAIPGFPRVSGPSLSCSPNDSDEAPLVMEGMCGTGLRPFREVLRSNPQPIMTGPQHIQPQADLSPRTTRRNMLATELTESLRRHLLWERRQKSSTTNAVLKRRHTSHDMANLKHYPEKPCIKKSEDAKASSGNRYFFSIVANDGYHSHGW
ncbi:hypothetical protein FOVSG1_015451 [Fusarium oxysporum f. sp. vasinfectum]